ncbi:MAG TPA: glutathione S-transferase family protein [Gammaproteobacteria bacterium]|nr:glutathione S-transferase family protein [Gammaproteobacteria bacterium]
MADITFYTHPQSRGRTVHWLLEELGVPYDMKILDFDKREHKAPSYLAINPMGKVPAIVHRGVVVTEVVAICLYLADAFPKAGLAPALDDPKRGTYLRWFLFGVGCVEPAVIDKLFARPPARPGALGYGTYEDMLAALTTALTPGPFILGERFSAVDVYLGSQLQFAIMTKGIESTPVFEQYIGRWATRPALQRVLAGAQQ